MFDKHDSILVIGVGRSGLATAEVLRARGVTVVAYDDKPPELLSQEAKTLTRVGVPLISAAELESAAKAATGAVVSPGVPLTNRAVLRLQRAGIPVFSEIELAYRISSSPIIAVTGSKGKSTTAALIGHLLNTAGIANRVGGNIGNPLIRETAAASSSEWVVAEVSSFQLEGISTFAPRISVLLNISQDHLDRYHSMEEYAEAKYRIFANQKPEDVFVGNADDDYCALLRAGSGRSVPCRTLWFGMDPSDKGLRLTLEGGDTIVARNKRREATVINVHDLRLQGLHNVANVMAATLVALSAGVGLDALHAALGSFEPLPHRLTTVHQSGGIIWVDDSKATNPAAATAALEVIAAPVILIAGGKSKKTDFTRFAAAASKRAKLVILMGETAREIGALVAGPPVVYAPDFEAAVDAAAGAASSGDVVLLSPASASFDMFESAEQRGEQFALLARRWGKPDAAAS